MKRDEIPPGSLTLLILRTLARHQRLHGYGIAESILQTSGNVIDVEEGSLYPALQRMLANDWVKAEWGVTEGNRRARYYQLTAAGKKQLTAESKNFERVYGAIARVLQTA